jgi:hypothetical protein
MTKEQVPKTPARNGGVRALNQGRLPGLAKEALIENMPWKNTTTDLQGNHVS